MNRVTAIVVALVAAPSLALLTAMPTSSEAPSTSRVVITAATPIPPRTGNAGYLESNELGGLRSSGLLSSTPIAADHEEQRASAQLSSPRPSARLPPPRYATLREFAVDLDLSTWPTTLRPRALAEAVCESGVDLDGDGTKDHIDLLTPGDHGESRGPMKIYRPSHPDLVAKYDLDDLRDNLDAGYEAYEQARVMFGNGWQPWSKC